MPRYAHYRQGRRRRDSWWRSWGWCLLLAIAALPLFALGAGPWLAVFVIAAVVIVVRVVQARRS